MFPNLSLSPPVSQRHTAALKSTASATALPKCHHSAQHTRCVTDWAGASFCALHYMKTDDYLHDRGICNTRITYKSTNCFWFACSLQRAQLHAVLAKQRFFPCELRRSQENPHTDNTGSPSFTKQKSKAGLGPLGSQHLPVCRYTWCKAAVTILGSVEELHVYCIMLSAKTKVSFKYSLSFFFLLSWTGTNHICYSIISKAKLFETE